MDQSINLSIPDLKFVFVFPQQPQNTVRYKYHKAFTNVMVRQSTGMLVLPLTYDYSIYINT